jgi:hypothetical protein
MSRHFRRDFGRFRLGVAVISVACFASFVATDAGSAAVRAQTAPRYQFGINTYATYACQDVATYKQFATTQFRQFKSLHANAVAIAFPLYTDYPTSNVVYAETDCSTFKHLTPPAAIIGDLVDVAHGMGLKVMLRPLIDQTSFIPYGPYVWRGVLQPSDVGLWFRNYLTTLRPYLQIAQARHVEHFALETELTSLAHLSNWTSAVALSKAIYKGDLAWNMSWHSVVSKVLRKGTSFGIDAYPSVTAASTSSVSYLVSRWNRLLRTQPKSYAIPNITKTTIDEIGIPAQKGLYVRPSAYGLSLTTFPFDQTIQARWFAAACTFMKQHHMQGIYYWGPWLARRSGSMLTSPSALAADDIQPAAAQEIKHCF